jgi:hypothetical protein
MSTENILGIFLGVKGSWRIGLTTMPTSMSQLSRKCGKLNILQPYGPPRTVTGIALPFSYPVNRANMKFMLWVDPGRGEGCTVAIQLRALVIISAV